MNQTHQVVAQPAAQPATQAAPATTISISEIAVREEKSCFCICEYGNT